MADHSAGNVAPLPELLRSLRTKLVAKTAAAEATDVSQAQAPCSISLNERIVDDAASTAPRDVSNSLLDSVTAHDAELQHAFLSHVKQGDHAVAVRVDALRQKRRQLQARQAAASTWRDCQRQHIERQCQQTMAATAAQNEAFEICVAETDGAARQRLQMLFFESAAEIKKALDRIDRIGADSSDESASMVAARTRRLEWQLFATRLEEDCSDAADIHTAVLFPPRLCTDNAAVHDPSEPQSDDGCIALRTALRDVVISHGPNLASGQTIEIDTIVSVKGGASSLIPSAEKTKRSNSSLHFSASSTDAWQEIIDELQRSRARPLSSARSTRRIKRLPSGSSRSSSESATSSCFRTDDGGRCSKIRHLTPDMTPQFANTKCDIPLSSAYIQWLHPAILQRSSTGSRRGSAFADCNIYFDLAEYYHNYQSKLQVAADLADVSTQVTDAAVLTSVHNALRSVNAILESYRLFLKANGSIDFLLASYPGELCRGYTEPRDGESSERLFVRGSILQLVQTAYYNDQFLTQLSTQDRAALLQRYPAALIGSSLLSALFVPVATIRDQIDENHDGVGASAQPNCPEMVQLSDDVLHELMLVYIVRATQCHTSNDSSRGGEAGYLASIAQADAMTVLLPNPISSSSSSDEQTRACVIRNPRGLLLNAIRARMLDEQVLDQVDVAVSSDYLFVEVTILQECDGSAAARTPRRPKVHELLGPTCQWRSCLDLQPQTPNLISRLPHRHVCYWHRVLLEFISDDSAQQYLPNVANIRAALADNCSSRSEQAKRAILRSSSLLEEISSRQLSNSLSAFFDHVRSSLTNASFLSTRLDPDRRNRMDAIITGENDTSDNDEKDRRPDEGSLELARMILSTEREVTAGLRHLRTIASRNDSHATYQSTSLLDVAELNRDIRTTDLDLIYRLSKQKLQLVLHQCRLREQVQPANSTSTTRLTDHENGADLSSPVHDVVHVLRKGRRSLQRQQQRHSRRPQSASRRPSQDKVLDRAASDFAAPTREWKSIATEVSPVGGIDPRRAPRRPFR